MFVTMSIDNYEIDVERKTVGLKKNNTEMIHIHLSDIFEIKTFKKGLNLETMIVLKDNAACIYIPNNIENHRRLLSDVYYHIKGERFDFEEKRIDRYDFVNDTVGEVE